MLNAVKMAIASTVILSLAGAFWYVSGLRADLQQSQQNVATLEQSVKQQSDLIDQMQRDQREIIAARDEMQKLISRQSDEIDELRSTFNESADGSERDFGELALAKPGLVENIINRASTDALRCLELASGAQPTQEEIDENILTECNIDNSP